MPTHADHATSAVSARINYDALAHVRSAYDLPAHAIHDPTFLAQPTDKAPAQFALAPSDEDTVSAPSSPLRDNVTLINTECFSLHSEHSLAAGPQKCLSAKAMPILNITPPDDDMPPWITPRDMRVLARTRDGAMAIRAIWSRWAVASPEHREVFLPHWRQLAEDEHEAERATRKRARDERDRIRGEALAAERARIEWMRHAYAPPAPAESRAGDGPKRQSVCSCRRWCATESRFVWGKQM